MQHDLLVPRLADGRGRYSYICNYDSSWPRLSDEAAAHRLVGFCSAALLASCLLSLLLPAISPSESLWLRHCFLFPAGTFKTPPTTASFPKVAFILTTFSCSFLAPSLALWCAMQLLLPIRLLCSFLTCSAWREGLQSIGQDMGTSILLELTCNHPAMLLDRLLNLPASVSPL